MKSFNFLTDNVIACRVPLGGKLVADLTLHYGHLYDLKSPQ